MSRESLNLVEELDGLNRYRFGSVSAILAAWKSARNVVSQRRSAEPEGSRARREPTGEVKPAE